MANVQDRGPPSAAAIAIGTALVSGITGYYIGQASSIGLFGGSRGTKSRARLTRGNDHESDESDISDADGGPDEKSADDDNDDSTEDLGEIKTFPGNNEECKLVMVVRTDLGMTKGTWDHQHTFRGSHSFIRSFESVCLLKTRR